MDIDAASVDEVLATTRAVRRRLDLERPVDNELLLECIDHGILHDGRHHHIPASLVHLSH